MSGLLGSKPDTSGQERQLELQRQQIDAQEKRQQQQMAQEGAALQAKTRARQLAGRRMLLSDDRQDSELGIGTKIV